MERFFLCIEGERVMVFSHFLSKQTDTNVVFSRHVPVILGEYWPSPSRYIKGDCLNVRGEVLTDCFLLAGKPTEGGSTIGQGGFLFN